MISSRKQNPSNKGTTSTPAVKSADTEKLVHTSSKLQKSVEFKNMKWPPQYWNRSYPSPQSDKYTYGSEVIYRLKDAELQGYTVKTEIYTPKKDASSEKYFVITLQIKDKNGETSSKSYKIKDSTSGKNSYA